LGGRKHRFAQAQDDEVLKLLLSVSKVTAVATGQQYEEDSIIFCIQQEQINLLFQT